MSKDKVFYSKNTLNVNGNLIDLSSPKIMGILNITNDSFFDGGKYSNDKAILLQVEKLINDGADIIDLGGYSSRPGAKHIEEKLELERVLKGIKIIKTVSTNIPISIDTFRSNIARVAIELGAGIINDISAGSLDEKMFQTISNYNVPYIAMHMIGTPQNMAKNVNNKNILEDLYKYFIKKLGILTQFGIKDVIIDVGFGFSKSTIQNFGLLGHLKNLAFFNQPILVGISRKSMIYKTLKTNPEEALNGTTILNSIAVLKGANILRVHDVKEAKEIIELIKLIPT